MALAAWLSRSLLVFLSLSLFLSLFLSLKVLTLPLAAVLKLTQQETMTRSISICQAPKITHMGECMQAQHNEGFRFSLKDKEQLTL